MVADVSDFIVVPERIGVVRRFLVDVGDVADVAVNPGNVAATEMTGFEITRLASG